LRSGDADILRPAKVEHAIEHLHCDGHLRRLTSQLARAQRIADDVLEAADVCFHQGAPIVAGHPLPTHASAFGNLLNVPIALRRRRLGRRALHRSRARRHNDFRVWIALDDRGVIVISIVRAVTGERRDRNCDLIEQWSDLRAIIDVIACQLRRNDLAGVSVHPDVELPPRTPSLRTVLFEQPLTGSAHP
jgi:hypothetical protein